MWEMSIGPIHDERSGPFGIGGRKQYAHRPTFRDAEESRSLATNCIHDGTHIIHALLQGRKSRNAIRKAGTSFVEQNQTAEGCEPGEKACSIWFLPNEVQVGDKPRHKHEIKRAVSGDLIGDSNVAALGIVSVRLHGPRLFSESAAPERAGDEGFSCPRNSDECTAFTPR